MNADHADLNPRVSAQIRVPFSFCVFLKLKTSECERRILRLAGLESNTGKGLWTAILRVFVVNTAS